MTIRSVQEAEPWLKENLVTVSENVFLSVTHKQLKTFIGQLSWLSQLQRRE